MIDPFKKLEINVVHLFHPNVGDLDGLTIAHITDLHVGPWVRPKHVERIVGIVNERDVDLVALTGDYVGYRPRTFDECITALNDLESPSYAVLGNHDHWACTDTAVNRFDESSITLMRNVNDTIDTKRGRLHLAGVDDAVTDNHDVEAAHDFEQEGFVLTLNHVPEVAPACISAGADLVLSGHTHGLQFNVKGADRIARRLGMDYIAGGYVIDDGILYVSRGLGSASWPRRIGANPELIFYQLHQAPGARFSTVATQRG